MSTLESRLIALEDERAIRGVLQTYCRSVDRKDYDLLRTAYHPDAHDDHGLYVGDVDGLIAWLQDRHRDMTQSMHFLGASTIEVSGDTAEAETYCVLHQTIRAAGGPPCGVSIGCRYLDRFERRESGWRIADHLVVYEWWREANVTGERELGHAMTAATRSTADPVYARGPWPDPTVVPAGAARN